MNINKNYIVDEHNKTIAVQIPISDFLKLEEIIENYGLAKLIDDVNEEKTLDVKEAKSFYDTLPKNNAKEQ
jgi:hypothetical protein